jgi:glycosyltransferase involved in cell wall biosynthesis
MNRGGAEIRTLSLMSSLQEKGVDFEFCVLSGEKGVLDEVIRQKGGEVHYCKLGVGFLSQFMRLLKTGQFDVVHSHVSLVSGVILLLARLAGVKNRIAHFRSMSDMVGESVLRRVRDVILRRLLLSNANKILGVSIGALDGYWKRNWRDDNRFEVVYNGFNVPHISLDDKFWHAFIDDYDGGNIIVHVGRMDKAKNHLRLTKIFHRYQSMDPAARMVFIGKEFEAVKKTVVDYATDNQCLSKLVFLGEKPDVLPFVRHAKVMLFPSLWEGLPGALIEAASLGIPVLASDIPSVKEVAEKLPIVKPMSLDESDEAWAIQLQQFVNNQPNYQLAIDAFNCSGFLLNANLDKLYGLYTQ